MKNPVGELKKHNASGLWYVRIKGRKPPNKYLGNKTTTLIEAQEMRNKIVSDYEVANNTTTNNNELNINRLLEYYLENAVLKGKNKTDRSRYCLHFGERFGTLKVKDVKPFLIDKWIADQPTWNQTTQCNVIKHLAAAFNWMMKQDIIERTPIRSVKRPKPLKRGKECLISAEMYDRLLPTVKATYREIVECCFHGGMRPSEILGARKEEYRPAEHSIVKTTWKTMDKSDQPRIIVLNDRADAIIADRANKVSSGLLFVSKNGRRIGVDVFMQYMRKKFDALGFNAKVCNYSFRHSFAVRCLDKGNTMSQTAAFMGNTTKVCEEHYSHIRETVADKRHLLPQG